MDRSSLSRREYITQPLRGLGTAFASRGSPASVPEEKARVPTSRVPLENGDLRLVPASQARPPAPYVPAILFVIRAELLAQRRLFIQQDKQMHPEGNGCHRRDHSRVRVSENNPQPDAADHEADVHRVTHVSVEAHHYQSLRWSERRRRAASRPPDVPNAAKSNRASP